MTKAKEPSESKHIRRAPAKTPEARENQMIALAVDLAEEQLRSGTASSAVISHYLKLGTVREGMERSKMQAEIKLLQARAEAQESSKNLEEIAAKAIQAMREYSGNGRTDDPDL